jgi:MFS family permease
VEQLLHSPDRAQGSSRKGSRWWRDPGAWLREKKLSRGFWVFFTAAFFFDCGFAAYFFLFNLYLLDLHFNERVIGLIGGAFAMGSVVGTLPIGLLARRIGVRPVLMLCYIAAPIFGALRVVMMGETVQICFAFFAGLAMCAFGVCSLPAVARLTTEENRASAFALIYSTSIGTSMLGGVVCGYLPQWLRMAGFVIQEVQVKRLILLTSCGIAAVGLLALLRLQLPSPERESSELKPTGESAGPRWWKFDPFLLRFLPAMALWTAVLVSFTPFANVYLSKNLHIPLAHIGVIFSVAQMLQCCLGLLTPVLFRRLGLTNGIVFTQVLSALVLGCLAGAHHTGLAVVLFTSFSAIQWMSSPGLYNLLMSEVKDENRSTVSATVMFCNALIGSAATTGAGMLFARFGYPVVLLGIAVLALVAALLFRILISPRPYRVAVEQ